MMLSTKNERPNPPAIANVATISVKLVFLASLLAIINVIILDTPKMKNNISILTGVIVLSFKNAG